MPTKATPAAEAIRLGDIDEQTAWMMFDPSVDAEKQFIQSMLTIPNERLEVVDMNLYPQQHMMADERTGRDITIKGRQTRASSYILARNIRPMVTKTGVKQLVMTQDDQTTTQFRLRIKHHLADLNRNGWQIKIDLDNENELVIAGLENQYIFASGQQATAGRAYTAHIVHLSELSHWPNQDRARNLIGAITPAVPGYPFGQFDIESTPNGTSDTFYDYTFSAKPADPNSRWTAHFYPWWIEPRYKVGIDFTSDIRFSEAEYTDAVTRFKPDKWEDHLMTTFGLGVDQILWRRLQVKELGKTGIPFTQEYPETLDGCFVAAGDSFFASPDGIPHLNWYRQEITEPLLKKESLAYKSGEVDFYGPNLRVWEPPQPGQPYVGWFDGAGGGLDERSDFTALVVLNALSQRHVATLRVKCAPTEAAPMAAAIMTWYNQGLLGGERDAFGSVVVRALVEELQYPNIWYYVDPADANPIKPKIRQPWVHPTAVRNRILNYFRTQVFTHRFLTRDAQLLLEMGAFTWQKISGRERLKAAGKGQKDDLVMSCAGATFLCETAAAGYSYEQSRQSTVVVGNYGLVVAREDDLNETRPWLR